MNSPKYRKAEFTLGGYDVEKYAVKDSTEDDIFWTPLVSHDYWTVSFSSVSLQGEIVDKYASSAILDTGTSWSVIPTADFEILKDVFVKKYKMSFYETNSGTTRVQCNLNTGCL